MFLFIDRYLNIIYMVKQGLKPRVFVRPIRI